MSFIDDDDGDEIPAAHRIIPHTCESWPECNHIHIMLVDEFGVPIAQATVGQAMLDRWQRILNGAEEPDNEILKHMGVTQEELDH